MKKLLSSLLLISLSLFYAQLAVAQKESHKDYASMKISECNACHKTEGVAPNHEPDWLRTHRVSASKAGHNCAECHTQAYCLDCHQGGGIDPDLTTQNYRRDYVPRNHRSDFLEIHPIKALDNPQSCTRCHQENKFCNDCHSRFKRPDLAFASHRRQFRDIPLSNIGPNHALFTPQQCPTCHAGGAFPTHEWSPEHAREARRNLQACQTCHSDGDVCLTCHSARQGLRISPHPRNWRDVKNNYKDKSSGRTCIRCHDNF